MSQIQLGSLDYDEIRNELKTFLSDQEELKDYNFDGSILSTVLDLMAYNTMYYGFYSNMQANEAFLDTAQRTESLISLAKPLGYVVPHRKSATVQVTLTGVEGASNTTFGRYAVRLTGSDLAGTSRTFYNIEPITMSSATTPSAVGVFHEAKELVLDATVNVDLDAQKFTIFDTTVDPIGIIVKVNGTEWRKQESIDADLNALSEVYFVEPSKDGYVIRMGGLTETESGQIIGKGVAPGDVVTVSYFSSNGSLGNNITGIFGSQDANIQSAESTSFSSGGFNSPNPDTIKFFAPRFFATQNRAVTAEDFKTIAASLLGLENDLSKISVFGGEDLGNLAHLNYQSDNGTTVSDPEAIGGVGSAGEVYISYVNPDGSIPTSTQQGELFAQLKTKSVAGLSLKYYPPTASAELIARVQNRTVDDVNTFNTLFSDGYGDISSAVFANATGRPFTSATMSFTFNQNTLTGNKLFFKNRLIKENWESASLIADRYDQPDDEYSGIWYDLSTFRFNEPASNPEAAGGGYVSSASVDAYNYIPGQDPFPLGNNISTFRIFWSNGELALDAVLTGSSHDYGNIKISADVDFIAPNQNQTIYVPHNLYVTSRLENTL